ncbi:hypothetical protein MF265_22335 [Serratia marcescens]|uniref:hypothetical protein n=1 Tax=Serratia marcescens TaxID=615 RepID=UPI001EF0AF71|nr:hypothetical protein [Serratia marcescens]ULH10625.1 hypothetical protein MF265_22335 [Serratia marcescens]
MFNPYIPPQANCRVLLTYTGGVITGVRVAKDGECLNSVSAFADAMYKRGYRLVSVQQINRVLLTVERLSAAGEVSPLAAQQLTQQLSGLLNGEEVSYDE